VSNIRAILVTRRNNFHHLQHRSCAQGLLSKGAKYLTPL
jgi:hypothetical protein